MVELKHILIYKMGSSLSAFPLLFCFFTLIFVTPLVANVTGIYNVTDFGAVGDGKTLNTKAIQTAIDACAKKGGGSVHFPAGTYLSGTIYLMDNIRLNLEAGSILLGSNNVEDYPLNKCNFPSYSDRYVGRALIWGEGLSNITITGRGTINGQGHYFCDNRASQDEWIKNRLAFIKTRHVIVRVRAR